MTLTGHSQRVKCVSFGPQDGQKLLCSGSDDKTVRLWSVSKKKCVSTFVEHTLPVSHAIFSPNGKYVSSSISLISHYPLSLDYDC